MASKLVQLQSKACQASKFVSKHGGAYYKQLLEQNKQYIQDPPTVEKCNLLSKQLLYTRLARIAVELVNDDALEINLSSADGVENSSAYMLFSFSSHIHVFYNFDSPSSGRLSIPVRYEAFWKELDYAKHLWKHRQELKVEDAGIAALFGLECFAWYCAGEIVGRGFTFTGYYV
ncbi:hypothetical protein POTOM_026240 [Populus tomentosa]|uniref:Mitochondrial ATP synthase subunit G protein n=1 Tax=Populus tomentosa TaxID=118781 RepID=A0A8X8CXY5_POPTO|nr:hypothetical protein POTOM_026240 [Populus tomentosa]